MKSDTKRLAWLGLAIGDWADRSGCSITGIFAWRSAQRSPNVLSFSAAAEVLGFALWVIPPTGMPRQFNSEKQVAEEIRCQRKKQRMTLEKLAAASTVSASTILAICAGARGTQMATLNKIAAPLGIRLVMRLDDAGIGNHAARSPFKPATEYPI